MQSLWLYAVVGYPYNMQFQNVSLHLQCNGSHNGQERPDIFPNHDNKVNSEYCLDWISKTNAMDAIYGKIFPSPIILLTYTVIKIYNQTYRKG